MLNIGMVGYNGMYEYCTKSPSKQVLSSRKGNTQNSEFNTKI